MRPTRIFSALSLCLLIAAGWGAPAPALGAATALDLLGQARDKLEGGQTAQALALTELASRDMWNHLGLRITTAVLIKENAKGYGLFNARKDNVFPRTGEPFRVYLEMIGYKVANPEPGLFAFGIRLDAAIINARGQIIWGKENIVERTVASRRFTKELYIPLTFTIKKMPPGEYVIKLTAHDKQGGAPSEVRLPIKIQADNSTDS